jgi:hypothetical protein
MTDEDIEAIRKRNEERRASVPMFVGDNCDARDRAILDSDDDIETLLVEIEARDAEIERLRDALEREFHGLATVKETADILGSEPPWTRPWELSE